MAQPKADASPESAYERVALACNALYQQFLTEDGAYPSVSTVQAYLKEHLGGGIKRDGISDLIRKWETETNTSKAKPADKGAAPEAMPLDLEAILAQHPDLKQVMEIVARLMAKTLEARAIKESEQRVRDIASALENARTEAAQQLEAVQADHAAVLEEREKVIDQLRAKESALDGEKEQLAEKVADLEIRIEGLGQELALAKSDARQKGGKVEELTVKLAEAEARATGGEDRASAAEREVERLRADLAASQQAQAAANEARSQTASLVDGLRSDLQAERSRNDGLHERIERLTADLATASARSTQQPAS